MMKKILLTAVLAISSSLAFSAEHAHWSYEDHGGPKHWGELEEGFGTCKLGKEQSPIDIQTKSVEKGQLPAIKTNYVASPAELVNNGHTIQVNLAEGGSASLSNGNYKLLQFHFHTPSEEKINGKSFPMVAHLVHKNEAGNLAVIGILFKAGKENAVLKDIFTKLPAKESKETLNAKFDVTALLPASLSYYSFKGSLTTPPCSEGVSWHVLKTPVELSKQQIAAFKKIFKMNARPVQPLNDRKVVEAE